MQHTASSASDPSRDIRIFREETHGGQIFTTFFAVDQLCKLIPNSNVETLKRVGSRRVCIYISLQDIVLSFTRDRASDDFKQWNQKFGNCVYLTSNKFAWLYSIIEERDEFVRCQARVLMMLRKKRLVNCQINL